LWRAWKNLGGADPVVAAGHSLGEYTAMVAAGVLDFAETMKFVRLRAQVMQEAVPEGRARWLRSWVWKTMIVCGGVCGSS
jgi:[acyl-carrier-protein] S-malonyltransferase